MHKFSDVLKIIRRHQSFLLTTHQGPDADAIGSTLAMALYLKSLGKKVTVVNEDTVNQWLKFLPKISLLRKASELKNVSFDAAIILDCGDLKRTGTVAKYLTGKPIVNIDHHITNDFFGTINVVNAKASSTAEMVFDFLTFAKHPLNKDIAMLLYAGIMTDTGSFRYENTTAHSHDAVGQLMKFKISAPNIYDQLYAGIPVADIKVFTELIHNAELLLKNKVYCVAITKEFSSKFSKGFDLKEKLFTFLRSVEGIEVVAILTELSSKEVRVNFRSQGDFNVAALAQKFDGGGHIKAAGAKLSVPLDKAKTLILSAIKKSL